jgi:hypothetical protein
VYIAKFENCRLNESLLTILKATKMPCGRTLGILAVLSDQQASILANYRHENFQEEKFPHIFVHAKQNKVKHAE